MKRSDGKQLEDYVFENINEFFERDIIPIKKSFCSIHRNKKYFSDLRQNYINFENVVECFSVEKNENAQPFLAIVFECKDTNRKVEVGEIEEFAHKINQGLGLRIKGYIVTKSGFQSSTLNIAKKLGIGLIRILPDENKGFAHAIACNINHLYTIEQIRTGYLFALCGITNNFDTQTEFLWHCNSVISDGQSIKYAIFRELIRSKFKFQQSEYCHFKKKKNLCYEINVRNATKYVDDMYLKYKQELEQRDKWKKL